MKPRVLVTREIPDEAVRRLKEYFRVESNQKDAPVSPRQLLQKLRGKDGAVTLSTDVISDGVLGKNPQLKIVSNVAVGYNNRCYAYLQLGDLQKALDDCTQSLKYGTIPDAVRKRLELIERLKARETKL